MFLLARIRVLLARRPAVYWSLVVALAGIVVITLASAFERADQARRSWGSTTTAWVALDPAAPGDVIVAEPRDLPLAMVPSDAVDRLADGQVAVQHVGAGEIVTIADVGGGAFALVPDGWQAIAIVTDPATLPAEPGDHVAIYAQGAMVAGDGVVIEVDDASVIVGVPLDVVAAVAHVALDQQAVLTWRRP